MRRYEVRTPLVRWNRSRNEPSLVNTLLGFVFTGAAFGAAAGGAGYAFEDIFKCGWVRYEGICVIRKCRSESGSRPQDSALLVFIPATPPPATRPCNSSEPL